MMAISISKSPGIVSGHADLGINVGVIYAALKMYSNVGEFPFNGPAFDQLAWAIAWAVDDWIDSPLNVTLVGVSVGTAGVGAIMERTSRMFLAPVIPLMTAGMESAGLNGPLTPSLSTVVTLAIAHVVTQFGGYTGVCPTVGTGTDTSKVVWVNVPSLIEALIEAMAGQNMTGAAAIRMANGLGMGIAALVLTAFGTGTVTGASGPMASTGPSFSKVG